MYNNPKIKLYGSEECHKTTLYKNWLEEKELAFQFLDVVRNETYAEELRNLYENKKLNFPTITIGNKKLRNPSEQEIEKWINKLIPERLTIFHDKLNKEFTLDINGEIAKVEYLLRDNIMYLQYAEVPYNLRGQGIGKVLVEKTFEQVSKEAYKAVAICSYIKMIASGSERWRNIIEH